MNRALHMPRTGRTALRVTGWFLLGLLVMLTALVILALTFDWNRARGWIGTRASEAIGRNVEIRGDLTLSFHRPEADQAGWARWVPLPRLHARDVYVANTQWGTAPQFAHAGSLHFLLRPLPLLRKELVFAVIALDDPAVSLQRLRDGDNNWTFRTPEKDDSDDGAPSRWTLKVERVVLQRGRLNLDDARQDVQLALSFGSIDDPSQDPYGLAFDVKGRYHGAPLQGAGRTGAVLALQDRDEPFPVEGRVDVGKTSIAVDGTLSDPINLTAVDMKLKLAGANMAHLYPLLGVNLPDTSAFRTEGRLHGTIDRKRGAVTYEGFTGRVGNSDLGGTLRYEGGPVRPLLKGELRSKLLRFDDLAPLIGADSAASQAKRDAPPAAATARKRGKVLPTEPFEVDRWDKMDADVKFTGERILRDEDLPIDNLSTHLVLRDGVLNLAPLNFGVAGGTVVSNITLDSRQKPMTAKLDTRLRRVQLKRLFPAIESMQGSFGQLGGQIVMEAQGNSVASLLGSADGEARVLVTQGSFSKFLLEAAGLNVANVVLTRLFGDRQVQMNCLAGDFGIDNGVMDTRAFLLDTEEAFITMDGTVDMKNERLDLVLRPEQKSLRIFSLRAPLYVRGSFDDPAVSINAGVVALRAGSAVALGLVAPVAAILPLVDLSEEQEMSCRDVIRRAGQTAAAAGPAPAGHSVKAQAER